ncbi:hypothetical protein D3C86_1466840 [compost metagenome]
MSTGPDFNAAAATASAPSFEERSPMATSADPPEAIISAATSSALLRLRPCIMTMAPSLASILAMASPKPELDPVTRARMPFTCMSIF